jgi:hypothetical protein
MHTCALRHILLYARLSVQAQGNEQLPLVNISMIWHNKYVVTCGFLLDSVRIPNANGRCSMTLQHLASLLQLLGPPVQSGMLGQLNMSCDPQNVSTQMSGQ